MDPSDVSDGDLDDESSAGDVEEQEAQEQRTSSKKRKRMRRRTQRRNAQRRAPKTLFWHSATPSHGVWGGLVQRTDEEKWATIYERRVQLLSQGVFSHAACSRMPRIIRLHGFRRSREGLSRGILCMYML